jgi:hypothetical protein
LLPSAEEATEDQGLLGVDVGFQAAPKFVEVYIGHRPATATNLVPSSEEATDPQLLSGAVVWVQVAPELLEV